MSNSRLTSIRQRIEAGRENLRRWRQAEPPPLPRHKPKEFKYLKPRDLRSMTNMLFAARAIVEGYYSGRHRSRFKGNAPEFVDYRQYNPGDELRSIDWKAYARTDRHYIKLFEKEIDLSATILLDVSASMAFGGTVNRPALPFCGLTKLEYGSYLAAALSYVLIKQGDKAGLAKEAADMAKRLEEMADGQVVFDIENEYKESLRDFAERLTKANEQMNQAGEEMGKAGEPGEEQKPGESPEGEPGAPQEGSPLERMQAASKAQQEALDQLAENAQQFKEGIQQANENLEHVAKVMGDTEQFKYLYGVQKSLERSIGYYKQLKTLSPEDQVRLDELSVQQQEVQTALAELKETIRLHADELDALAAKQKGTDNETTPAAE